MCIEQHRRSNKYLCEMFRSDSRPAYWTLELHLQALVPAFLAQHVTTLATVGQIVFHLETDATLNTGLYRRLLLRQNGCTTTAGCSSDI